MNEPPFSMSFVLGPTECQVCGETGGCDHLRVNSNGYSFAISPEAFKGLLEGIEGKTVTPVLLRETADKIVAHLPPDFFWPELEVKSVHQEGDRLITTVGRKEERDE